LNVCFFCESTIDNKSRSLIEQPSIYCESKIYQLII